MPLATFYNLADAKRKQFLKAAYQEFALNSFAAASVTNLVKTLGIAKGSVYQYFTDKEDLHRFLATEANNRLGRLLDEACPYEGEDFFAWYTKLLLVEVKFYLSFPHYALLFRQLPGETGPQQKALARELATARLERISAHLPATLYGSPANNLLLSRAGLLIFEMLTQELNLGETIARGEAVYLEAKELVAVCSGWVKKLKYGL